MNRYKYGVLLGFAGAIISLLEVTSVFVVMIFYVDIMEYLVEWYVVAAGLAFLVLFGAFTAYAGRKILGGRILLVTPILATAVNLALWIPYGGLIPIFYYQPLIVDRWLFLSAVGGILVLISRQKS